MRCQKVVLTESSCAVSRNHGTFSEVDFVTSINAGVGCVDQ